MPQIPRASDINRKIASGQQAVSRQDTSMAGTGLQVVGDTIGKVYEEREVKRTNYQMAQAKTNFLKAKTVEDNAYENDEDYLTMPDRYNDNMRTALEDSASLISNPEARLTFEQNAELDVLQGYERISNLAGTVEKDYQRGYITEGLADIRESALTGNVGSSLETAQGLIASAIDMNYMTAEEGAKAMESWKDETLTAKIRTMEPEDRLGALKEPWAAQIPTDLRTSLQREAKTLTDKDTALAFVDALGSTPVPDAWEEIAAIDDEDVRREAESRYDQTLAREQRTETLQNQELFDNFYTPIRLGELTVDDIPREDIAQMGAGYEQMVTAQNNYLRGLDPTTPRSLIDSLNTAYMGGKGNPAKVRAVFEAGWEQMSRADFDSWSKVTADGFGELENDSYFTATQMISGKVRELMDGSPNPAMVSEQQEKLDTWLFDYRRSHEGEDPSGEEIRTQVNYQMLEVPTRESWKPMDESAAGFTEWDSMDTNEQTQALAYLETLDREAYYAAVAQQKREGSVSPKRLAFLFSEASEEDDR